MFHRKRIYRLATSPSKTKKNLKIYRNSRRIRKWRSSNWFQIKLTQGPTGSSLLFHGFKGVIGGAHGVHLGGFLRSSWMEAKHLWCNVTLMYIWSSRIDIYIYNIYNYNMYCNIYMMDPQMAIVFSFWKRHWVSSPWYPSIPSQKWSLLLPNKDLFYETFLAIIVGH